MELAGEQAKEGKGVFYDTKEDDKRIFGSQTTQTSSELPYSPAPTGYSSQDSEQGRYNARFEQPERDVPQADTEHVGQVLTYEELMGEVRAVQLSNHGHSCQDLKSEGKSG